MQYIEMTLSEIRRHLTRNSTTFEKINLIQETVVRCEAGEKLHAREKYACDIAQTVLMEEYAGFIKLYAKKYIVASRRSALSDFDDTIQVAKLGFLKAIHKYDVTKGIGNTPIHVLAHYYMTEALCHHVSRLSSTPDPFRNKKNRLLRSKIIAFKRQGLSLIESYELLIKLDDEKWSPFLILTCVRAVYEEFNAVTTEHYNEGEIAGNAYLSEPLRPAEEIYIKEQIANITNEALIASLSDLPSLVRDAYLHKRGFSSELQSTNCERSLTNNEIADVLFKGGMSRTDGKTAVTAEAVRMMFKRIDQKVLRNIISKHKIKTLAGIM